MFESLAVLLWILITGVAAAGGYARVRRFVRERLRFVDAVHRRYAPLATGVAAALLAAPIVFLLPVVGLGTAALFGLGVGLGVAAGRRDLRSLPGA